MRPRVTVYPNIVAGTDGVGVLIRAHPSWVSQQRAENDAALAVTTRHEGAGDGVW